MSKGIFISLFGSAKQIPRKYHKIGYSSSSIFLTTLFVIITMSIILRCSDKRDYNVLFAVDIVSLK
jgi:hypothetical protein